MYGKLNQIVKEVRYTGGTSDTIDVEIDNTKNIITANIKNLPNEDGEYILKAHVVDGVVTLQWELQD